VIVLAIDPGSSESGVVLWDGHAVRWAKVESNEEVLIDIANEAALKTDLLAIEMIGHYGSGLAVGKTVFDTCVWLGRFLQCWIERREESTTRLVLRPTIKTHLCGTPRAKDGNVRTAVIDRVGPKGTKKSPGPTFGVVSHSVSALALAVCVWDTERIKDGDLYKLSA
jgi:hypothetical protein